MKTSCKKTIQLTAAALLLSTQSCTDDPIVNPNADLTKPITFTTCVLNDVDTETDPYTCEYETFSAEKIPNANKFMMALTRSKFFNNPITVKSATADKDEETRGVKTTSSNFASQTNGKDIAIRAFLYDTNKADGTSNTIEEAFTAGTAELYINDLDLTVNSTSGSSSYSLTASQDYFMPTDADSKTLVFYGIYPSPTDYQPSSSDDNYNTYKWDYNISDPTFSTTVEEDCTDMKDYLFGSQEIVNGSSTSVNLQLGHIMTAVSVKLSADVSDQTIVSVTFSNIHISGKFHCNSKTWETTDEATHSVTYYDPGEITDMLTKDNNGDSQYFFMMPQVFDDTSDARLSVVVQSKDGSKTTTQYSVALKDINKENVSNNWVKGGQVQYVIGNKAEYVDYQLEVDATTPQPLVYTTSGYFIDYNDDGTKNIDDEYVLFYGYDGKPAGDGESKTTIIKKGTSYANKVDPSTVTNNESGTNTNTTTSKVRSRDDTNSSGDTSSNEETKTISDDDREVTISDAGQIRVLSLKKVFATKEHKEAGKPVLRTETAPISVNETGGSSYIDKTATVIRDRADNTGGYYYVDYNKVVKVYMSKQTGTEKASEDVTALDANKNKFTVKNETYDGTNYKYMLGNSDAESFKEYVDLSRYRPDKIVSASSTTKGTTYTYNRLETWKNGKNATRRSSNCYIINYPGYYKIPVIMGNFITNDEVTSTAYCPSGYTSKSFYLGTFVDYIDKAVSGSRTTTGWIEWHTGSSNDYTFYPRNDGKGASGLKDVIVVWTDSEKTINIVNYTEKVGKEYFINFSVGMNDSFEPCNAVIAVINPNKEILWSYHIWVTPTKFDKTSDETNPSTFVADTSVRYKNDDVDYSNTKAATYGESTFMAVPLGFEREKYTVYNERKTKVQIVQEGGKTSQEITLYQKAHEFRPVSCCYYQWGRKDPFPGFSMIEQGHINASGYYEVTSKPKTVYYSANYDNGSVLSEFSPTSIEIDTGEVDEEKKPIYRYDYVPYKLAEGETEKEKIGTTYTIGWSIKNPHTYLVGYRFPNAYPSHNSISHNLNLIDLWGCIVNDIADTAEFRYPTTGGRSSNKTIYDPCPPGFKVPPIYAFPAITADGKNHTSYTSKIVEGVQPEEEIYWGWANTPQDSHIDYIEHSAYEFYCKHMYGEYELSETKTYGSNEIKVYKPKSVTKDSSGGTFRLYALGMIEVLSGNISNLGITAAYWSCTRWSSDWDKSTSQRMDYFSASYTGLGCNFAPCSANTNSYGLPILAYRYLENI